MTETSTENPPSIWDRIFGRPLANSEDDSEKVGVLAGLPMLGLDGLSSAAYGPEAALTLLIPLGVVGIHYIAPISGLIVALLAIVYISYRQTIAAYPNGGGSYTVAKENLGVFSGLLAAAALLLDYTLTAAVGISAGIGALVSAVPSLHDHTLSLCLATLGLLLIVNLRGNRESGIAFMLPTYLFLVSLLGVIALGVVKSIMAGGHPTAIEHPATPAKAAEAVSLWLLMRAFASGCTAMTGVEAVSNGVAAFREPTVGNARRTLSAIIGLLTLMLLGIAYLCHTYEIGATDPGDPHYQSVLSQLTAAVIGKGVFYYITIGAILSVLCLSANTAFADFPRLCRAISMDGYLPRGFALRGRRLVYNEGVIVLATLTAVLLVAFGGITDRLIPLYAVGAFLAFTLSQAGMVQHWRKTGGDGAYRSMAINGLGAVCTGITLVVVLVSKFIEGAWITAILVPTLIFMFYGVHRHYRSIGRQIASDEPVELKPISPPLVLVPIFGWSQTTRKALRFAFEISPDVIGLHITMEEESSTRLTATWSRLAEKPAKEAGIPAPKLLVVASPFRRLYGPFLNTLRDLQRDNPGRDIAVVVPELVELKWWQVFLHNQTASVLKASIRWSGLRGVAVVSVPWYLSD